MEQSPVVHNPALTVDCYTIVPHPNRPQALLFPRGDAWSLPHFVPVEQHPGIVDHINRAIKSQLGIDATVLRCVYNTASVDSIHRVYALENHSPNWAPPVDARWVGRDELAKLTLAPLEHRVVLEAWFNEAEVGDLPALRRPWARPGWFDVATSWVHAQLAQLGLAATTPIEQIRTWTVSCILRVPTATVTLYFKAVPSTFDHGPALMQYLARQYSEHFPTVLAVDTERGWLLMEALDGRLLTQVPNITRWEEALSTFAQIQIDQVERVEALLALGCSDRRLAQAPAAIDALFADAPSMLPERPEGLSEEQMSRLRTLGPRLKAICGELAALGIPPTLEHSDFYAGNIIATPTDIVFFDWDDSCISHPFFSAGHFLEAVDFLPDIPNVQTRLRDAYLEPWTAYAPIDLLVQAFELARLLAALHQALNHHRFVASIESAARWEMEATVPFWLKAILRLVGDAL